jgi:hypothetical protein
MEGEMICIGSGYGQWLIWVLWRVGRARLSANIYLGYPEM